MNPDVLPTEAEQLMISAMMQDAEAIWRAMDVLPLRNLLSPRHEVIAAALQGMAETGLSIDVITLGNELHRTGLLGQAGNLEYLHLLSGQAPTWHNVGYYAEIVRTEVETRRLREAAKAILEMSGDPTLSPELRAEQSRAVVDDALDLRVTAYVDPMEAIRSDAALIGRVPVGLRTPWPTLTGLLGGLAPGALYTIGARPRIGKSVAGLQIAEQMLEAGDVLYVTLEMSRRELVNRLVSANAEIDLRLLSTAKAPLQPVFQERVDAYLAALGRRPGRLHFLQDGGYTIAEIIHEVRTLTRRKPIVGVVIDHMHLMRAEGRTDNRVQELTQISGGLKRLAKMFNIPVVALAQLNRGLDTRSDRTPTLADLRDSGTIEQDSDVVILLDRDHTTDYQGNDVDPTIYFHIPKNRQGPSRTIPFTFEGPFVRIVDHNHH